MMTKTKLIALSLGALVSLAHAPSARAGRGGSYARIKAAALHGAVDAVVSELERAEDIPCNSECMGFVIDLTGHKDYRVREAAAWWLARRPAQRAEVVEVAEAALASGDTTEIRNAADVLGTFSHPSAVAPLAAAFGRGAAKADARVAIVRALGRIAHRSANDTLALAMADGASAVRREAITAWRGVLRQEGAAPVAGLVADADVAVRREAASVVGMFREASARGALEAAVTGDADPMVRRNAAWALGRIGDAASKTALRAAVEDDSALVRMTARAALRQLR
jgi:HEAT repeat protein